MTTINRERVVDLLKLHEHEFHEAGIGALYVFGSVARDKARDTSDVDIFFDLDRPQGFTLFNLVAVQARMQDIFGTKVDVMTRNGIHPRRRGRIEASAIRVF